MPGESIGIKKKNFQLFYNRVGLADNTILVKVDGKKFVYLNYEAMNYMVTQDEQFCNNVENKMQRLMRKSTLLTDHSEKQRNIFFNALLNKLPKKVKA